MASGDEEMFVDDEAMRNAEDFKLPPKIAPSSAVTVKTASEFEVELNGYMMDIRGLPREIYHYRISFTKHTDRKTRDLTRGQKQDFIVQSRRRVCMSLFNTLVKKHAHLFPKSSKYSFIYDCGNSLFMKKPLPDERGDAALKIDLLPTDISSANTKKQLGPACVKVEVEIQFTHVFTPTLNGEVEQIRETQQFLEILTSAGMVKNEDHLLFGNKAYERSSKNDAPLPQGKVVKCGFEKNCRVVESAGEVLAMLQIGDVAVRTTHTEVPRVVYINGLSKDSALSAKFEHEGEEITVYEYFRKRYKRELRYPNLPLCIERKPQGFVYHPMEVLEIERGQRVTTEKQTPQMSESMIRECQLPPVQMRKHVEEQISAAGLNNDNPYFVEWGVKISTRPMRAVARRFHPPAITYGGSMKVQPNHLGDMQWKLGAREQFAEPAKLYGKWTFIIFDGCVRKSDAESFIDALSRYSSQHGVQISARDAEVRETSSEIEQNIDSLMRHLSNSSKFVMFTTKAKLDPVHGLMKRLEAQYGLLTQHLSVQTLNKAIGQKGAFMVLGNLCLKLNLKLGGINHILKTCDQFSSSNPNIRNVDASLFPKTRMFVGFDISHAGPQSFADRQMKVAQSEPTVVGEPRLNSISDIATHFTVALQNFLKETNSLPLDIVVFRGGVSEGEFKKAAAEMIELQKAFVEVNHLYRHGMYSPSLTCLVVQTNSNYRIIPTKIDPHARPMDQNVPSGTVVDDALHPAYNEFLIVPQKALQGTARTLRCTLVTYSKGTSGCLPTMEELKQITNMLCHGHQVVCGTTTLPSVCTSATNLSKRGRNNWKAENFRDMEDGSVVSGGSGDRGRLVHDGTPDFFKNLSARLHCEIDSHYWA
ncbi:unnamed protein product [Haemonchus placei]|uniref:Piwi domain-containing protein n=1 Tax=Haemonchus placei TaxID=6290 RepID=A0A0N4WQQ8_HAEPC|nr:unnamed protein product [Haemonchus placei]